MATKIIERIKQTLGSIPRQNFLFYNKREAMNVISSCYEQIKINTDKINEFIDKVNQGAFKGDKGDFPTIINILYKDLINLVENNKLIPGAQYRITDFVTTVAKTYKEGYDDYIVDVQTNLKSANHPFDLIVTAVSTNEINENVKAIQHEGDEYFAKSNLNAWEVKYSLYNDTDRFSWAKENGKGVIYYLKDELNNEAPFDFKNILHKIKLVDGQFKYTINDNWDFIIDPNAKEEYVYTFNLYLLDKKEHVDCTIAAINGLLKDNDGGFAMVENNIIKPNTDFAPTFSKKYRSMIYNTIFLNIGYYSSWSKAYIQDYKFHNNYVGYSSIVIANTDCRNIRIENNSCVYLGQQCYNNIIYSNSTIFMGNGCYHNVIYDECRQILLKDSCIDNIFNHNCYELILNKYCWGNTFGCFTQYSSFGEFNCNNIFNDSRFINIYNSNKTQLLPYIQNCIFNGAESITIKIPYSVSSNNKLQNVEFRNGSYGKDQTLSILAGRSYKQYVGALDYTGLKIWRDNA